MNTSRPGTPKSESDGSNRRNYFRINQDLVFDVRPVDAYAANHSEASALFDSGDNLSLVSELRRVDRQAAQTLKVLAEKDSLLGDYLHLLTQKIDLVARHTLLANSLPEAQSRKRINLSEAGLAFRSDKPYYTGKFLAVRLIFLPDYVPVTVFAEVTRCQNGAERAPSGEVPPREEFEIAARFHRLSEKDRQELSRQIIKAQVAHRKIKSNAPPSGG